MPDILASKFCVISSIMFVERTNISNFDSVMFSGILIVFPNDLLIYPTRISKHSFFNLFKTDFKLFSNFIVGFLSCLDFLEFLFLGNVDYRHNRL